MFSVPSQPGENLGKVWENSRAGENPLICSRILPNVCLRFYQATMARMSGAIYVFHYLCEQTKYSHISNAQNNMFLILFLFQLSALTMFLNIFPDFGLDVLTKKQCSPVNESEGLELPFTTMNNFNEE